MPVVIWAAVYLYQSQKRIYQQSTLKTTIKYLMLGSMHFFLMIMVASIAGVMIFLK